MRFCRAPHREQRVDDDKDKQEFASAPLVLFLAVTVTPVALPFLPLFVRCLSGVALQHVMNEEYLMKAWDTKQVSYNRPGQHDTQPNRLQMFFFCHFGGHVHSQPLAAGRQSLVWLPYGSIPLGPI